MKREVRICQDSWGPEWSCPSRHTAIQRAFAGYLDEHFRPDAIAILNTPSPLGLARFRTQLSEWRNSSENLHPRGLCPSRSNRKFEYIASLEYGLNPRRAREGRLHAHVLLYNLNSMRLEDIARQWRELNKIKNPEEPLLRPYTPGPEGILYALKSWGSDVDLVHFSPKLRLNMAAK